MNKRDLLIKLLNEGITDKKILAEKLGYIGRSSVSSLNRFAKNHSIEIERAITIEPLRYIPDEINKLVQDRVDQILLDRIDYIAEAVKKKLKEESTEIEAVELFHIADGILSGKTSQRTIRIDDKAWEELNKFSAKNPSVSKTDIMSFLILEGIKKYS